MSQVIHFFLFSSARDSFDATQDNYLQTASTLPTPTLLNNADLFLRTDATNRESIVSIRDNINTSTVRDSIVNDVVMHNTRDITINSASNNNTTDRRRKKIVSAYHYPKSQASNNNTSRLNDTVLTVSFQISY